MLYKFRQRIKNKIISESIKNFFSDMKYLEKLPIQRLNSDEWTKVCKHNAATLEYKIRNDEFLNAWTSEVARLTNPGESVVEIGCAFGATSLYLAKRGRICTGIDYSSEMCELFLEMGKKFALPVKAVCADVTKRIPLADDSFDVVFHAGLIEHFPDDAVCAIIKENARITKGRVISMAPNAASLAYRIGKEYQERTGTWAYGEENPKHTLKDVFDKAGLRNIREYTIDPDSALYYLPAGPLKSALSAIYENLPTDDNAGQGYLLVTIGEK